MKISKPSKETMLKGLLLLVVGLNFSWKPLMTESHHISLAQSAPPGEIKELKIDTTKTGKDDAAKFTLYCGHNVGLRQTPDGLHYKMYTVDDKKTEIECKECEKYRLEVVAPNNVISQDVVKSVVDGVGLACDAFMTDQEKEAFEAKKKEAEEKKLADVKDKLNCLVDAKGNSLESRQQLNCELKNMEMSDSEMQKLAGKDGVKLDKDDIKKIRDKMAGEALKGVAQSCKKSRKDGDDFQECDDLVEHVTGSLAKFEKNGDADSKKLSKNFSSKLEKLDDFVTKEKKADETVANYKKQYEKINAAMEKAYNQYAATCDSAQASYSNSGRQFDSDACKAAYLKDRVLPVYAPQLRNLTTKFTSEEKKFDADFTKASQLDIIGKDGRSAGLSSFMDYTKSFSNSNSPLAASSNNSMTQGLYPMFKDDSSPASGDAMPAFLNASQLQGNDLISRFGDLPGARQYSPFTASAGATGTNAFPLPAGITGGQSTYNRNLPLNSTVNRQRTVNAGMVDAGIFWN